MTNSHLDDLPGGCKVLRPDGDEVDSFLEGGVGSYNILSNYNSMPMVTSNIPKGLIPLPSSPSMSGSVYSSVQVVFAAPKKIPEFTKNPLGNLNLYPPLARNAMLFSK